MVAGGGGAGSGCVPSDGLLVVLGLLLHPGMGEAHFARHRDTTPAADRGRHRGGVMRRPERRAHPRGTLPFPSADRVSAHDPAMNEHDRLLTAEGLANSPEVPTGTLYAWRSGEMGHFGFQ